MLHSFAWLGGGAAVVWYLLTAGLQGRVVNVHAVPALLVVCRRRPLLLVQLIGAAWPGKIMSDTIEVGPLTPV